MSYLQSNAVIPITAAATLSVPDSGKIFLLTPPTGAGNYVVTLPAPTAGVVYTFIILAGAAANRTITITSTAANQVGFLQLANAVSVIGASTSLTFGAAGVATTTGDSITLIGTSTNWIAQGKGAVAGSIVAA